MLIFKKKKKKEEEEEENRTFQVAQMNTIDKTTKIIDKTKYKVNPIKETKKSAHIKGKIRKQLILLQKKRKKKSIYMAMFSFRIYIYIYMHTSDLLA